MNALVPVSHAPPMTISDVERVALAIAKGGLFGSNDPNAVLTLCLLAQAEGQHPAVVFRDYHIIQGKPAKKAEAMLRDFITSGGKVKWHTLDDACADATFSHPSGEARIEWTLKRATTAGLTTPMWKKYPRQMLRSRVISEGIRTVYPGATSGLYESGEVADITGTDASIELIAADPPAEKVPGIHKIKAAIREMKAEGNAADSLDGFNQCVAAYEDQCATLEQFQHSWWTGIDGDGNEFESVPAWIARRRAEITPAEESVSFQLLMSTLAEVETPAGLQNFMVKNDEVIATLDGEEARRLEAAFGERETALNAAERISAGA